jgi:outer membrane receptor protein involved in Fe transport
LLKVANGLNLRFAAYGALARPDYSDRLPRFSYNGNNNNLFIGNLGLKDAKALNVETSVQMSGGGIGLFTVSGFYKKIDNLFHQMNGIIFSWPNNDAYPGQDPTIAQVQAAGNAINYNFEPSARMRLESFLPTIGEGDWLNTPVFANTIHYRAGYTVFTGYNSKDPSYIWGVEIEHQMNFSFLPVSWLRNIVLSYNVTMTRSKTNVLTQATTIDSVYNFTYNARTGLGKKIKTETHRYATWAESHIENQPELYGNISLGYDIGRLSARFSVFYNGKYLRQESALNTADAYTDEFIKCDLAMKYEFNSMVALMLNVNNIFNRQDVTSQYNEHYDWGYIPTSQGLYGASVDLGVRVTL